MKKFYSLFAAVVITASFNAQTTQTTVINVANIGGTAVLGTSAYNGGAERVWQTDNIAFGGKAITANGNNTPAGTPAGTVIQAQANNGVIYNTTPLPGRLVSITLNYVGNTQVSSLYGGSTERLVNSTAANYTVAGTQVGGASSTGWTATDLQGTNHTYFAIKRGGSASYISSIDIVYEMPTMAVDNISKNRIKLVKNTIVTDHILFNVKGDLQVMNANGQIVKTIVADNNSIEDVSSLAKGVYIVTGSVNGTPVSQKIIKK